MLATNKTIEAIKLKGSRFVIGVQWHPELLPNCDLNRKIFKKFIEVCNNENL